MNKSFYYLFLCLGLISFSLSSCGSDDDNGIDEVWKAYQDTEFNKVAIDPAFHELKSETNSGSVYWKVSTVITNSDLFTSAQRYPELTDTVVVRYEGWYFDMNGKKNIFDTTENPATGATVKPAQFVVNQLIIGWTMLLQDMTVGEEREVCIPQQLGYGYWNVGGIPAYTTLWFRIKLLDIKSKKV